jgi:hypothetical protein
LDELMPAQSETTELRSGLRWDYSKLGDAASAVIEHTIEIKRNERRANEAVVEAGRHLIAVKESLSHGQWGDWLETEFAMSDSTAQTMMNIARRFGANSQPVGNLSYSVLGLLASPSVPEAAVNEVVQRSQAGDDVTKAQARAVIDQHRSKKAPIRHDATLPAPGVYWTPFGPQPKIPIEEVSALHNLASQKEQRVDAPPAESGREGEGGTPTGKLLTEWTDEDWAAYAEKEADDAQVLPMHVAGFEMPDDLIGTWSPRFDGGSVYLVDALRNRSTETVALDELDELFARIRLALGYGAKPIVVDGDRPLPEWAVTQPDEIAEVLTPDAGTEAIPDMRIARMARLINVYSQTITTFDEYGNLTGSFTETLPAQRELEKLIKHLRREMALLEGQPVEDGWGVLS